MNLSTRLRLYAITDPTLMPGPQLMRKAAAALRGGATALQYRNKHADAATRLREAQQLRALCAEQGALFLVNDDPALAQTVAADGVHLGQSDAGLAEARARLGPAALIGISCHGQIDLARRAAAQGANYVAFGRFFPSHTKPQAPPAPLTLLDEARATLDIPWVAIGGITADNAPHLIRAGAHGLAVIHALFAGDPAWVERQARLLTQAFDTP